MMAMASRALKLYVVSGFRRTTTVRLKADTTHERKMR